MWSSIFWTIRRGNGLAHIRLLKVNDVGDENIEPPGKGKHGGTILLVAAGRADDQLARAR